MEFIIYTDGGAKGNPGPAGIGVVIKAKNKKLKTIRTISKYLGILTNNQAEYYALITALEEAKKMKGSRITCFLDSELIVKQLTREYKIKDKKLASLFIKVWNLSQGFKKINFFYIPREKNKEADWLVNLALSKYP